MRITATLLSVFLLMFIVAPAAFAAPDKDCKDFKTQEEAQQYFESHGGSKTKNVDGLDRDHDGIACENLPKGSSSVGGGSDSGSVDKSHDNSTDKAGNTSSQPQQGGKLPKTASPFANMMIVGVAAVFAGIGLLLFNRKLRTN